MQDFFHLTKGQTRERSQAMRSPAPSRRPALGKECRTSTPQSKGERGLPAICHAAGGFPAVAGSLGPCRKGRARGSHLPTHGLWFRRSRLHRPEVTIPALQGSPSLRKATSGLRSCPLLPPTLRRYHWRHAQREPRHHLGAISVRIGASPRSHRAVSQGGTQFGTYRLLAAQ